MTNTTIRFADLDLSPAIQTAIEEMGFETPSPIQAQAIPALLQGRDVLGMAQTGTGKTGAFALPLLSRLDLSNRDVQILVLAPTRELALQVAEACQHFARHLPGFHLLPVYGGQEYGGQIRALKRGVQVVVGTPGRVMDHIRKGTLKLDGLQALVLDEADEMLRMGFLEDVEWILDHTPSDRQLALFSATMPKEVHRVTQTYLQNPVEVVIKQKTATATTITQKAWLVDGVHKLDALTRIFEAETFDGVIIFVRTKTATTELAEALKARGYLAEALNGDIPQANREKIVDKLKSNKIDMLVATDVVARGLDVERISHVVNYDIPYDTESYVHRIGRTGRAGRSGTAILFVAPRERRLLKAIEQATNQPMTWLDLPSAHIINDMRKDKFKQQILDTLAQKDVSFYHTLIEELLQQTDDVSAIDVAAAMAKLHYRKEHFLLEEKTIVRRDQKRSDGHQQHKRGGHTPLGGGMIRYRIGVGKRDGAKIGNVVGCIANEGNLQSNDIQNVRLFQSHGFVDLPQHLGKDSLNILKKARVAGRKLDLAPDQGDTSGNKPYRKRRKSH